MTENKNAPAEGPNGVDGWTSNGYGLLVNGKPVDPPEKEKAQDIEEVEET